MKKKIVLIAIYVLTLALLVASGSTIAWLVATSGDVVNTFLPSDISITLSESDSLDLKMVPGCDIDKDPKVTIKSGSEKCYVFVKIVESGSVTDVSDTYNFNHFLEYSIAAGWTVYSTVENSGNWTIVIYRIQEATTADVSYNILNENKVTVKDSVTKSMMNAYTDNSIKLTFTAAAVQFEKIADVVTAFGQISW